MYSKKPTKKSVGEIMCHYEDKVRKSLRGPGLVI